jgi:hypothetical protein
MDQAGAHAPTPAAVRHSGGAAAPDRPFPGAASVPEMPGLPQKPKPVLEGNA